VTPVISVIVSWLVIAGVAFANVDVGSTLPNPSLDGLDGIERPLVDRKRVTVFLFFDPQQDHSIEVLSALAELQRDLEDADVRWVGVVSDRFSPENAVSALNESGARLETVIDSGDRLYGELGVRLYPTLGIADAGATLRAYLPYSKINYMSTLEAHLLHTLGRIDDAELDRAMHPTAIDISSSEAEVGRTLKLARMLWANGKKDKALTMAREAAEKAPDLAEPHALVGVFLVEDGRCEEARASLDQALEIDPDHPEAKEALLECQFS
jgi:tetratricopeptide (TPR) repeat protein